MSLEKKLTNPTNPNLPFDITTGEPNESYVDISKNQISRRKTLELAAAAVLGGVGSLVAVRTVPVDKALDPITKHIIAGSEFDILSDTEGTEGIPGDLGTFGLTRVIDTKDIKQKSLFTPNSKFCICTLNPETGEYEDQLIFQGGNILLGEVSTDNNTNTYNSFSTTYYPTDEQPSTYIEYKEVDENGTTINSTEINFEPNVSLVPGTENITNIWLQNGLGEPYINTAIDITGYIDLNNNMHSFNNIYYASSEVNPNTKIYTSPDSTGLVIDARNQLVEFYPEKVALIGLAQGIYNRIKNSSDNNSRPFRAISSFEYLIDLQKRDNRITTKESTGKPIVIEPIYNEGTQQAEFEDFIASYLRVPLELGWEKNVYNSSEKYIAIFSALLTQMIDSKESVKQMCNNADLINTDSTNYYKLKKLVGSIYNVVMEAAKQDPASQSFMTKLLSDFAVYSYI